MLRRQATAHAARVIVALLAAAGCSERIAVHAVSSDRSVAGPAPAGAESFTDPQGTYTLMVDPAWVTLPGAFTNDVVTDTDGHRLGEIEFTGIVPMSGVDRPLHFLTYFDFKDGQAVVVTLSTSEATFEQAREQAEPYLRTLRET